MNDASTISIQIDAICRVGVHGQVGRMRMESFEQILRGDRVLCRTDRGIEVGETLTLAPANSSESDGVVLRRMTPADDLLYVKLREYSADAYRDGCQWIESEGMSDVLIEVEPLMDGRTLYFHFLGSVSSALGKELNRLAELYQVRVAESQFAKLLEHGCGPDCGTEEKSGCGSGSTGCAVCVIATACKK